jgi:hypothetical protein
MCGGKLGGGMKISNYGKNRGKPGRNFRVTSRPKNHSILLRFFFFVETQSGKKMNYLEITVLLSQNEVKGCQ